MTDLKVTFTQAEYYSPVSTPADFRQLTPYVFRLALQQSGVDILEPMLCFELQIPQEASSKAITDLQKMMSEIEDISCNNEWCRIKGKVPLNTSKDYASEVSSYTKGLGVFMVKPWPGNVRELRQKVMGAVLQAQEGVVMKEHLELAVTKPTSTVNFALRNDAEDKERILRALKQANGNRSVAAELLGIGRTTLYSKLEEYGLKYKFKQS